MHVLDDNTLGPLVEGANVAFDVNGLFVVGAFVVVVGAFVVVVGAFVVVVGAFVVVVGAFVVVVVVGAFVVVVGAFVVVVGAFVVLIGAFVFGAVWAMDFKLIVNAIFLLDYVNTPK